MRKLVLATITILGTIVCLAGLSAAQPAPAPAPSPPPAPVSFGPPSQVQPPGAVEPEPEPEPAPVEGRRLNEGTALGLSLGGTLASWATLALGMSIDNGMIAGLGAIGTFLGPNFGHWYAGMPVTRGTGLRIVGALGSAYGFVRMAFCEDSCRDSDAYIFFGGALVFIGATIDDIVTAPLRVRKHNQRLEAVGLLPVVTDRAFGLAIGGRF